MKWFSRLLLILLVCAPALGWGKKGHETVNKLAIRCLPAELKTFYQKHESEIVAQSIDADDAKRRRGPEATFESVSHFLDMDQFGDPKHYPRSFDEGAKKCGLFAFMRAGLLPWRVRDMFEQLVGAFKSKDVAKIVEYSAWLGHYAGDGHQPLHACANYDGQLTKNDGVHARYESEMLDRYDWEKAVIDQLGQAKEIADPFEATFDVTLDSFSHVEEICKVDTEATSKEPLMRPGKDGKLPKNRSDAYYKIMYDQLHVMTEQRLAKAATWAASLWYSAWIKAGKPELN